MQIILLLIIGAAAGFLATRLMRLNTDIPTTMVIGVAGALVGGFGLRLLAEIAGWAAGFVGALAGALVLIWIWKTWFGRRG